MHFCLSGRKRRAGFTLMEVMLALVILGVGLTAITQSVMMVMRSSGLTARYTQATILAQNKMEEVLARAEPPKSEEKGEFEDHPGMAWKIVPEKSAIENLAQIRVLVTFSAPGGTRTVEYVTLMANRTPPAASTSGAAASGDSAAVPGAPAKPENEKQPQPAAKTSDTKTPAK